MTDSRPEPSITASSRFKELLQKNDPPSDIEMTQLRTTRSGMIGRIEALDARIHSLEQALRDLKDERDELQKDFDNCSAILSPIRRIPFDVSSEIFRWLIEEDLECEAEQRSTLDFCYMPWVVARVAHNWRTVALELPRLWSTIRISNNDWQDRKVSSYTSTGSKTKAGVLGLQLHRSGLHPLSVSLQSPYEIARRDPILDVLLPTSPRWRDLSVALPTKAFKSLTCIEGSLQSLEVLHLYTDIPTAAQQEPNATAPFQFAPRLHTLYGFPETFASSRIPLSNITTFRSGFHRRNDVTLKLLAQMPKLESFTGYCEGKSLDLLFFTVTLLNLRYLSLTGILVNDISTFLNAVTAPQLISLDIKGDVATSSMVSFLTRSHSRLRNLSIASPTLLTSDCIAILDNVGGMITSLTLNCRRIESESVLAYLISKPFLRSCSISS